MQSRKAAWPKENGCCICTAFSHSKKRPSAPEAMLWDDDAIDQLDIVFIGHDVQCFVKSGYQLADMEAFWSRLSKECFREDGV
jgi:hypothetical protein